MKLKIRFKNWTPAFAGVTRFRNDTFLSRAAQEALRGIRRGDGGPFGAVIVKGGRVLAQGHNTVLADQDPTCHAEMNTIRKAAGILKRFDLSGCEIYSTTEPCPMCFSAIHWARIQKIVYSTTIDQVKKLGFNELPISNKALRKLAKSGVEIRRVKNKDCEDLLTTWAALPSPQTY